MKEKGKGARRQDQGQRDTEEGEKSQDQTELKMRYAAG